MSIQFDLTTLAGRQACVLWHVGLGRQVREAARLAGVADRMPAEWRRKTPGFAARLDEAKRRGWVLQHRHGARANGRLAEAFLARLRRGQQPSQALKEMGGLRWGRIPSWSRSVPGFHAEYAALRRAAGTGPARINPRARAVARGLEDGLNMAQACHAAGIRVTSVQRWRYLGRPEWDVIAPHWRPRKVGPKSRKWTPLDGGQGVVVESAR